MKSGNLLLAFLAILLWFQPPASAQTECSYQNYFDHDTSLIGKPRSLATFTSPWIDLSLDPTAAYVYSKMSHGVKLTVAIDRRTTMTASARQSYANLIFNIWNRDWVIFRGFPFTEYKLLVFNGIYTEDGYGEHGGGFYVGLPFSSNASPCETEFYTHGIFHAWLSGGDGGIIPDTDVDERHKWFVEGVTQYYGVKQIPLFSTGSRRPLADIQADFHQQMVNWHLAYYLTNMKGTPDDIPLIEMYEKWSFTDKAAHYYMKGALVAYLMDKALHSNNSSLDSLMYELYTRFNYGGRHFTTEDVLEICVELAGESCRTIFNNHVYGNEPLPMDWNMQFTHFTGTLDGKFVKDLPIKEIVIEDETNPGLIPILKLLLLNGEG